MRSILESLVEVNQNYCGLIISKKDGNGKSQFYLLTDQGRIGNFSLFYTFCETNIRFPYTNETRKLKLYKEGKNCLRGDYLDLAKLNFKPEYSVDFDAGIFTKSRLDDNSINEGNKVIGVQILKSFIDSDHHNPFVRIGHISMIRPAILEKMDYYMCDIGMTYKDGQNFMFLDNGDEIPKLCGITTDVISLKGVKRDYQDLNIAKVKFVDELATLIERLEAMNVRKARKPKPMKKQSSVLENQIELSFETSNVIK